MTRTKLTPPKVAERYGISADKVIAWIRAGELRAIDVATRRGERPRYLIDEQDLAAFERSREVVPASPRVKARKRPARSPDYVKYFEE